MPRKKKSTIKHVPGVHWTQVPENKEILSQIRRVGQKTRARNKELGLIGRKGKERPIKSRITRAQARRAARAVERERAERHERNKFMQHITQEMLDNGQLTEAREQENSQIKQASIEEVARICYAKCETWISTYADFNGVSESAVAGWVGRALVAKASR